MYEIELNHELVNKISLATIGITTSFIIDHADSYLINLIPLPISRLCKK